MPLRTLCGLQLRRSIVPSRPSGINAEFQDLEAGSSVWQGSESRRQEGDFVRVYV